MLYYYIWDSDYHILSFYINTYHKYICVYICIYVLYAKLLQSCPTLCNAMDCSLSVSSVHGIFQARILEWVAFSFSRGSSQARDQNLISSGSVFAGRFFTSETPEKQNCIYILKEMGIPDHLICLLRNLYAGQEATVRTGYGTTD